MEQNTPLVTVISCSHPTWMETSQTMGKNLAKTAEAEGNYTVAPVRSHAEFFGVWATAGDMVVVHTHGSPSGLYSDLEDGRQIEIASLAKPELMPANDKIQLAFVTACQTAGQNERGGENLACALSKRISPNGIVVATKKVCWGWDTTFGEKEGTHAWTVYQNGSLIVDSEDLPVTLTMDSVYAIYMVMKALKGVDGKQLGSF